MLFLSQQQLPQMGMKAVWQHQEERMCGRGFRGGKEMRGNTEGGKCGDWRTGGGDVEKRWRVGLDWIGNRCGWWEETGGVVCGKCRRIWGGAVLVDVGGDGVAQ